MYLSVRDRCIPEIYMPPLPHISYASPGKFLFVLGLLCWFSVGTEVRAQHFARLTVDDGLSQGFVRSILQTRDGFMWFATLDGLDRYDGNNFKVFRNDPSDPYSINSDFVLELLEDAQGVLWVITDKGPNLYDPASGRFYQPPIIKKISPTENYLIRELKPDPYGHIWAIFSDVLVQFESKGGATPEQRAQQVQIHTEILPKGLTGVISSISVVGEELWIIAEKGCFAVSLKNLSYRPLVFDNIPEPIRFWEDKKDHVIWVIHPQGLSQISNNVASNIFNNGPPMAEVDGIHCASGIYFFSLSRVYKWQNGVLYALPEVVDEKIISAFADSKGLLWVGTNAYGVYKILTGRTQFTRFFEGRSQIRAPEEDQQGRVWVAGDPKNGQGYFHYDLVTGEVRERLYELPHNKATASKKGGFWLVLNNNDVCYLDRPGGTAACYTFAASKNMGLSCIEDQRGRFVNTTREGLLVIFDPDTRLWSYWSFAHLFSTKNVPSISQVLEDPRGGIFWIGTTDGLVKAEPSQNGKDCQFNIYNSQNGLSRQRILSLANDPSNPERLWIGTQHGLNWLDKNTGIIEALTLRDGLPNDVIYSILPACDSILWVGTNAGLLRINHRSRRWQHFTTYDGLPGSEFNTGAAKKLRDGRMIMGGVNGFVLFDPGEVQISNTRPVIAITEMLVNFHPFANYIDTCKRGTFRYDQNFISFQFALLDYTNPSSNRYQYRLIGANTNWSPLSSEHSATFSNLPPGQYSFEVRGVNSEGVESAVTSYTFAILRPWWRSIWAFVLYGVALFSLSAFYFQWRNNQRELHRNLEAEHREAERLKELDKFKSRLYANITHEFRTPLTVILGTVDQLGSQATAFAAEQLRAVRRNGEQLLRLVDQMLDWSKLENDQLQLHNKSFDLSSSLAMCAEPFRAICQARNLAFSLHLPQGECWIETDPDRLNDIVSNLLSNAVKFTPSGGQVSLSAIIDPDQTLRITVSDTGIGIAPEHLPHIFDRFYQIRTNGNDAGGAGIGLAYAHELAYLMGGRLEAESAPNEGTTISLFLPYHKPADIPAATPTNVPAPEYPLENLTEAGSNTLHNELPVVLLVEDNVDVARYTAACLKERYRVVLAENGAAGMEKAFEIVPDLIVSDIMMPVMDGFQLCNVLKQDVRTSHIPLVMLTARVDEESQMQGMQYGADAYLKKPFRQEALLLQLDNLRRLQSAIREQLTAMLNPSATTPESSSKPPASIVATQQEAFVKQVFDLIKEHYADPDYSANDMFRALHMSSSQLHRKLTALIGKSPGYLLRRHRLEQGKKLLSDAPSLTVSEVAFQVGYRDANYFIRAFTHEFGISPGAYRKAHT